MAATFEHIIISLAILVFAAKVLAEVFHRLGLPVVLGELIAGILVGPYALGGAPIYYGEPLVTLDHAVVVIGEIGAVVILFVMGLEITPREFVSGGIASFTVGSLGVVVPFFVGYYVLASYGMQDLQAMLIATALAATSIAISVQALSQIGRLQSSEARLIIGAAVVDDILAIAVLSVVTTFVDVGEVTFTIPDVSILIAKTLLVFGTLLVGSILIVPRVLHLSMVWKSKGSLEAVTTALFFGVAGIAGLVGLSPIIGSFAVGMSVASSHVIKNVEEYVDKLNMIFAPLFFAIIGAQVDFRGFTPGVLLLTLVVTSIALLTKLVGCGLPSLIFLRRKRKALAVGAGMMARMEVALVIAGIGLTAGILDPNVYAAIIAMTAVSAVVAPIILKFVSGGATDGPRAEGA